MNNTLVRSILAGLLLGAALFVMPFFLIRLAFFLLLIGALFRLIGGRRFRRGWGYGPGSGHLPAFADRVRQMSNEEYAEFRQRFGRDRYRAKKDRNTAEDIPNQ